MISNYPDGSENDPSAPWNQKYYSSDEKECEDCKGKGYIFNINPPIETLPKNYREKCDICNGHGYIEIEKDEGDDDKD